MVLVYFLWVKLIDYTTVYSTDKTYELIKQFSIGTKIRAIIRLKYVSLINTKRSQQNERTI